MNVVKKKEVGLYRWCNESITAAVQPDCGHARPNVPATLCLANFDPTPEFILLAIASIWQIQISRPHLFHLHVCASSFPFFSFYGFIIQLLSFFFAVNRYTCSRPSHRHAHIQRGCQMYFLKATHNWMDTSCGPFLQTTIDVYVRDSTEHTTLFFACSDGTVSRALDGSSRLKMAWALLSSLNIDNLICSVMSQLLRLMEKTTVLFAQVSVCCTWFLSISF